MPKDTDGDNELDPIDFYTCTLDLNHWKHWFLARTSEPHLLYMHRDFVLLCFKAWWTACASVWRRKIVYSGNRLIPWGWLWEGEKWERMGNRQDISITRAEFQVEHFNLWNSYTSFKIHSRMKGRPSERGSNPLQFASKFLFLRPGFYTSEKTVVESMEYVQILSLGIRLPGNFEGKTQVISLRFEIDIPQNHVTKDPQGANGDNGTFWSLST